MGSVSGHMVVSNYVGLNYKLLNNIDIIIFNQAVSRLCASANATLS